MLSQELQDCIERRFYEHRLNMVSIEISDLEDELFRLECKLEKLDEERSFLNNLLET